MKMVSSFNKTELLHTAVTVCEFLDEQPIQQVDRLTRASGMVTMITRPHSKRPFWGCRKDKVFS